AVELLGIRQDRGEPLRADVRADAFDDLGGRQRLAEDFFRELLAARRDDVSLQAEPARELLETLARIGIVVTDAREFELWHEGISCHGSWPRGDHLEKRVRRTALYACARRNARKWEEECDKAKPTECYPRACV